MLCLREWRRWIRPLVGVIYVLVLCVGLPLMIVGFHVWSVERHQQAWYIAGVFVLLAIPISIWGILQHLIHYTQPSLQRYIVRILWMVPIYAANAWLALRFKESAIYLDTARECYEAYVIYNFMSYLLAFLRQGHPDLERTIEEKPQVKHLIPFCCFPAWKMGRPMITSCKHGVLQYAVVRPVTTIVALLCQWGGVYHEGDFDFHAAWAYLVIINNISQIWAMYCLVLFYKVTREELAPVKPVGKFMCVKAIVFLTFWQAVFIAILVKTGVIKERQSWVVYDVDDVANGLQDFIICIEMFLAAIAHYFCFSHKPYVDYAAGYANWYDSFISMFNVSDVRDDVVEHVRHVGKAATGIVRAPLRRKPPGSQGERTPLLDGTVESGGEDSGALAQSEFRELKSVLSGQDEIPGELLDDSLDLDLDPTLGLHAGQQSQSVPSSENLISLDLSVDLGTEFHSRSYTASMNNYLEFEESTQTPTPTPTPTEPQKHAAPTLISD